MVNYSYIRNMVIKVIKDINGNAYYAVDINIKDVDVKKTTFRSLIYKFLSTVPNANDMHKNLLNRNIGTYHLTIANVPEYNKTIKQYSNITTLPEYNITGVNDIIFKGIGSIEQDNLITYFVVCESEMLEKTRTQLFLKKPRDFHITIGFNKKDLFNDRKNVANVFSIQK